ncbi:MAG: recombinase family protein [Clostridiales bacterium]|nr:recombinase family protein [Clostridiales bacterium]
MSDTLQANYVVALYIRLSEADRNVGINGKDESESITGQRNFLHDFISHKSDFEDAKIIEFCDDGKSGTNFSRSGIKQLLDAAKSRSINCIIVKDLSRFGRNYIEVGDYIEQIFPFLGIRFIAVNDNYDSIDHPYGSAGLLDVSFKNVIYDLYSKELSQKTILAHRQLADKGYCLSSFYGYERSLNNKHELIVNETAAAYVREIFKRANNGEIAIEIARDFNLRKIPSPSKKETSMWRSSMISTILRDERYTGCVIYGKTKSAKIGSKQKVKVDRAEWSIVQNAIPTIISMELFQSVQAKLKYTPRNTISTGNKPHIFYEKVKCGHCNYTMRCEGKKSKYYHCVTYRLNSNIDCQIERISENALIDTVLASIRQQAQLFRKAVKTEQCRKEKVGKKRQIMLKNIADLESVIGMKTQEKMQAFEDMVSERITQAAYRSKCESCDTYICNTKTKISALKEQCKQEETVQNPAVNAFLPYTNLRTLTRDIVDELIDNIYVYSGNRVEIIWKYNDSFMLDETTML